MAPARRGDVWPRHERFARHLYHSGPPMPRKQLVDGGGFLNLGRSYRLQLIDEAEDALKPTNGRFRLRREDC
jgi:hypothetical protein